MDKQEFVDELRMALGGSLSASAISDHVNYYQDYINTEIRKGRSEESVMESLGDPRLIARTILDTSEGVTTQNRSWPEDTGYEDGYGRDMPVRRGGHIQGWFRIVLIIFVVICVISAAFSILSFLLPVLIPVLFVMFMVKLFRDWLH